MANLKAIRIRIASVKSTKQITSAMKMVAAAKLRKAQDKILRLRPYANKMHEILTTIIRSYENSEVKSVYGRDSEPEKVLVVVITSNRGLCGAFNSNIVKEARRMAAEDYYEQNNNGNLYYLAIGKKGYDSLRKYKLNIIDEQNNLLNELTFDKAYVVAEKLLNSFISGEYDRIILIYNQFRNAAVQNLINEEFLPFRTPPAETRDDQPADYIFEPDREENIQELIPKYLRIHFYKAILNSYVAENGARMTAMHKATDNATTMIRELTLQYNKARQASITGQILEVVSGAEALKG
jgi:F-type H+-transporting ATPase subunit gamma